MINRSNIGKTEKFQGLVKTVQGTKPQEEPRISREDVISAFQSFGFTPNDRNHDDISLWTTKGVSEKPKLIAELSKRRKDINQREDDDRKTEEIQQKTQKDNLSKQEEAKRAMPRLSDQDISALFDEYGLPKPDLEWARNNLPNDPKKIRSILETQRKMADDMFKKESKNAVNTLPETPKMSASTPTQGPMSTPAPMPMMGQGGPGPAGMPGGAPGSSGPTTPFFVGDHAVVRITNPRNPNSSTTWLVDTKKKVLRPFMSDQAFKNAFESPEEAEKAIVTLSSEDLGPGGALEGFTPLKGNQGVNEDGSMDDIRFSPAQIQNRYGKPSDPTAENKSLSILDSVFGKMNKPQVAEATPQIDNRG